MPSILRHRLPFTYRPVRSSGRSNSCNRSKIFAIFTVQSNWLTNCPSNSVNHGISMSKPHQIIIVSVTFCCQVHVQIGFPSNWDRTHTHTVQAKPPERQRNSTNFPLLTLPKRTLLGLQCEPCTPKHHTLQVSPQPDSRSWSCPGECGFLRLARVRSGAQSVYTAPTRSGVLMTKMSSRYAKRRGGASWASPCSSPSPCTIMSVVPSTSSHKNVDALSHRTWRRKAPLLHAFSERPASWPTAR